MPHCHSFQLPDLLSIIGSLELRTNPHCRFVTDRSERWISGEPDMLTANELTYLHSTKLGLLAALCFPTCDVPQLRILTDFILTIFYSGMRECSPGYSSNSSGPNKGEPLGQAYAMGVSESQSAIDILKAHELFKQLRTFPCLISFPTAEGLSKHPQRPLPSFDIKGVVLMEPSLHTGRSNIPGGSEPVYDEPIKIRDTGIRGLHRDAQRTPWKHYEFRYR